LATESARARLRELHSAFDALTRTNEGLALLPQPPPAEGGRGEFTVRLAGAGTPQVHLRVHTDTAHLTARSGADHASAGDGEIHDRLGVSLAQGFAWDASVCSSAGELAGLLLKHMRRRLKAVDEVMPEG
jgi:hypothetical protein